MANFRMTAATRNSLLDQLSALIDGGAGGGTIKIYDGTQPATGDTAISGQTLLATLTFATDSYSAASGGSMSVATAITDETSAAAGTASWARIEDSDGVDLFDCDVGTSGATINLNSVTIGAGATVSITSFDISLGAG